MNKFKEFKSRQHKASFKIMEKYGYITGIREESAKP